MTSQGLTITLDSDPENPIRWDRSTLTFTDGVLVNARREELPDFMKLGFVEHVIAQYQSGRASLGRISEREAASAVEKMIPKTTEGRS